jgi:hypothetical protein
VGQHVGPRFLMAYCAAHQAYHPVSVDGDVYELSEPACWKCEHPVHPLGLNCGVAIRSEYPGDSCGCDYGPEEAP